MSDTPKTDAFIEGLNDDWDVEFAALTSHAKQLERDLNKARKALQEIASLDTSQDASPQQCCAVVIAMDALGI
jgi:hypothetical protein